MKKLLASLLAVGMILSMTACSGGSSAEYKLGMGIVVSTDSSKTGTAQVDATVATVILDKDGKIVDCDVDAAQSTLSIEEGELEDGAAEKTFLTKKEKKDDYNMIKYTANSENPAVAEWYQQAAGFAKYCIGKTAEEVENIAVADSRNDGYMRASDPDLAAVCTVDITDFKAAVVKACKDDQSKTFTGSDFKLGLAVTTSVDSSSKSAEDEDGSANIYSNFSAIVVDKDGKTLAALIDAIQPKIAFDDAGEIVSASFSGTKRELKDDYNMVKYGSAIAEWYQQSASLTDYVVGKTSSEITAIETTQDGEARPAADDLKASVTISIGAYQEILAKAIANAD